MSSGRRDIVKEEELKEIQVFDIRIHPLTLSEFLSLIDRGISDGMQIAQFGVNSAIINDLVRNEEYRNTINNADLVHIDGMSVVWALKLFGYDIPERVATPDLADAVLELADKKRMKVFLFGAQEDVLNLCRENIEKKYPGLVIAGCRNGYYQPDEEVGIFQMINEADPDILLLGMASPKKELFFDNYRHKLNVRYILGVGGYFDIMSGNIRRAPLWMQNSGFEWLFRLIQEPKRLWKRYLIGIFQFFWLVSSEKFRMTFRRRKQ